MKIRDGFLLKEVAGTYIVVSVGEREADFSGIISLNAVGAFLWGLLEDGCGESDLLSAVLEKYDVDEQTARTDLASFLSTAREHDLFE